MWWRRSDDGVTPRAGHAGQLPQRPCATDAAAGEVAAVLERAAGGSAVWIQATNHVRSDTPLAAGRSWQMVPCACALACLCMSVCTELVVWRLPRRRWGEDTTELQNYSTWRQLDRHF
jgi:hypothetical protein